MIDNPFADLANGGGWGALKLKDEEEAPAEKPKVEAAAPVKQAQAPAETPKAATTAPVKQAAAPVQKPKAAAAPSQKPKATAPAKPALAKAAPKKPANPFAEAFVNAGEGGWGAVKLKEEEPPV